VVLAATLVIQLGLNRYEVWRDRQQGVIIPGRSVALQHVRSENARLVRLAGIRKKEAAAIVEIVENILTAVIRKNRRDQWLFFALGTAVAIVAQLVEQVIR
jgi:predicted DNA-binding protein (UPF0251 family)